MSTDVHPDWSRTFDDPIALPDGRTLRTLHDAGHYAAALPKAAQERAEWQTAAEMLILAAQGQRPVMFADIAMRKALHAGEPAPVPKPRRKPARTQRIVLLESRSRVLDDVGIDSDADPDDADPSIIDLDLGNQWPYSPAILIQPCNRQMTDVS